MKNIKKNLLIIGFLCLTLVLIFALPPIISAVRLPDGIYITAQDVENANLNNHFSSAVSLDFDDSITVTGEEIVNTDLKVKLFGFITIKNIKAKLVKDTKVFVGGNTLGFNITCNGVIIVGENSVLTDKGDISPFKNSSLREGDAIIEIMDKQVTGIESINDILNSGDYEGGEIEVKYMRNSKNHTCKITPAKDILTKRYKLGMWVRNSANGIGTLTYIKQNNNRFGAVGHPIVDAAISENFTVNNGRVFLCDIVGIKKASIKEPGEIRGSIDLDEDQIGEVDTNCKYGVYGTMHNLEELEHPASCDVAGRLSVRPGNAKIYASLDGKTIEEFDIKIIKTNRQKKASDKSIIFKVTDPKLKNSTGGIIQGMSGSPIMQNGKLVGAVTHVFLNDATKGYGVYIDWMIDN